MYYGFCIFCDDKMETIDWRPSGAALPSGSIPLEMWAVKENKWTILENKWIGIKLHGFTEEDMPTLVWTREDAKKEMELYA